MFPISDTAPTTRFPIVNLIIIILNVFIFSYQFSSGGIEMDIYNYGFISAQFNVLEYSSYFKIFSAMFMHGGIFHVLSNMWFLYIFGDNVEGRIGHASYCVFYLFCGIIATLAQYILIPQSSLPLVGASGAVSGIAGAYFVFFSKAYVKVLIPIFLFLTLFEIPVWLFLAYWFITQFIYGIGSLVAIDLNQGGIAWFAHVSGFFIGMFLALLYKIITKQEWK
ncbi:rhomboid family intramembrane serine protease [Candidatus Roizmanbacteria bacterium]|nr:rhomboid family intramembrane serine protease [Candidatus Roizmanbacteria bacterium]